MAIRCELQKAFVDFFNGHRFTVGVAEFVRRTNRYNIRVIDGPEKFPTEWGAIVGEIAHNLRSALDGLAWQLAMPCPYFNTSFPIYLIGCSKKVNKRQQFWEHGVKNDLRSVDKLLWPRFEAVQPYKKGNLRKLNSLHLLHQLNRIDKHRQITMFVTVAAGTELTGHFGRSRILRRVRLKRRAKIADVARLPPQGVMVLDGIVDGKLLVRTEHEIRVDANIVPGVLFGDSCDAFAGLPVMSTIRRMTTSVETVINSFEDQVG